MKKFPKIIAGLLLISLLCGIIAVSVAAADTESEATVNQLTPDGATNIFALSFEGANDGKYISKMDKTSYPGKWDFHTAVNGVDKSYGFRYDGVSTTNGSNGISIDLRMKKPVVSETDGSISFAAISNVEDVYDYLVYDFDIGTDAYVYTVTEGETTTKKTYTLAELAALEASENEADRTLALNVKRYGSPAYHEANNFGPLFRGTTSYYYGNIVIKSGKYAIVAGSGSNITAIEHKDAFLSNKVGVYDHFTMVVDFATGKAETKGYIYYYLNGERFATFEIANANGLETDCFRIKKANNVQINLVDTYSMVFDNLTYNAYTAEQAENTLDLFFGAEEPAIDDLTACQGIVYSKNYVYGSGHKQADLLALKPAEGTVLSQDFNTGTTYTLGGYSGGATNWSTYNVTAVQKWMPNGNGYYSVSVGATASGNTQMYTYNPINTNDYDYITFDVDISTDLYAYGGAYYSVQDVEALKKTDPELAAKIEADGVATYIVTNQVFTINAAAGSVMGGANADGTGTPYTLWGIKKNTSGKYVMYWASKTNNVTSNYTTAIELSNEVGAFDHFTIAVAINHTDSTKTAVYSFLNGKVLSAQTITNSPETATANLLGFKLLVNGQKNSSLAIDNILLRTYDKGYASTDFDGIDDLLGKQYSDDIKNKLVYNYDDVTYNSDYATPEGNYVSLDDVNKIYLAPRYNEFYDALEEDGTLYLSGVKLENFEPSSGAQNFTVVCKNGATFSASSSFKVTEDTDDGDDTVTTYIVEPFSEVTKVQYWYNGEELLYEESLVLGDKPAFNPDKVPNLEDYIVFNEELWAFNQLSTEIVIDPEYSDMDCYDSVTGTVIKADGNGTLSFNVSTEYVYLPFAFLDAEGNVIDTNNYAQYADVANLKALYNANKANVATVKFFGDGETPIKIDVATNALPFVLAENQTLTIDLNGQNVYYIKPYMSTGSLVSFATLAKGSTLNIINGTITHVFAQGLGWMTNSIAIRNQLPFVHATGEGATLNLGVKDDATKAANFNGTNLISVGPNAKNTTVNIYGGTHLSGNLSETGTDAINATTGNKPRGFICLFADANVNVSGANVIIATYGGMFFSNSEVTSTVVVNDSNIICQTYKDETRPCVPANVIFPLFDNRVKGTAVFNNTVIVAANPVASAEHTITLGAGTRTNWTLDVVKNADNNIKLADNCKLLGSGEAFSKAFTYATQFEPIIGDTHRPWTRLGPKASTTAIPDDFLVIGSITHTATLATAVYDLNALPEGIVTVIWQNAAGETMYSAEYLVGATPVHPSILVAGLKEDLTNGWYDLAYSEWVGDATVKEGTVYTPAGVQIVADLDKTQLKFNLDLSSHVHINIFAPTDNEAISDISVRGSTGTANIGGATYVKGSHSINSTLLDADISLPVKYTVSLDLDGDGKTESDGEVVTFEIAVETNILTYVKALVAADTAVVGTDWCETIATFLQYRYTNYVAVGDGTQDALKAEYEALFQNAKLKDYIVADFTAYNPEALDIDKEVAIDTTAINKYVAGVTYIMDTNQPYLQLYINKAEFDALLAANEASIIRGAADTLGKISSNLLMYTYVTPTTMGTEVQNKSVSYQLHILGNMSNSVFVPTVEKYNEVDCYLFKIILDDLSNFRATVEFTFYVSETETLTGTYSLLTYIEAAEADANVSDEVMASLKAFYKASVASWNYKVTDK